MNKHDRHELDKHTADNRRDSNAFTDDRDVAEAFDDQMEAAGDDATSGFVLDAESVQRERQMELDDGEPDLLSSPVDLQDFTSVGEVTMGDSEQPLGPASVDEIGRAAGLEYQDDQPLDSPARLDKRDHDRWELNPSSAEDWPHKR